MRSQPFTSRAIAYLKGSPPNDGRPIVKVSQNDSVVIMPYLDDLHICYLVDNGNSYHYLQNYHLKEEGLAFNELYSIGLNNLERQLAQNSAKVNKHGQVYAFLANGTFEASALLVDKLWDERFREFVKGDYAVVAPTRDVLAFCDAQSSPGISELRQIVARVWPSGDHLVSDKIYIRQKRHWKQLGVVSP